MDHQVVLPVGLPLTPCLSLEPLLTSVSQSPLFAHLESLHPSHCWGHVLDAGTGWSSLGWLLSLPSKSVTAVTACPQRAKLLEDQFAHRLRPQDRIVVGNWVDEQLLGKTTFDVVLADYLIGAVDRFAPYFQDRLLGRLRRHVASTLYVVGLEPWPDPDGSADSLLVTRIANLRDASLMLSLDRPHREYPRWWVLQALERNGYQVQSSRSFPISYGETFVTAELDVCREALGTLCDPIALALAEAERQLRAEALDHVRETGALRWGYDYVFAATTTNVGRP